MYHGAVGWARHLTRGVGLAVLGVATSMLTAWGLRMYYQYVLYPPARVVIREDGKVWEASLRQQPGRYSVVYQMVYTEGMVQWDTFSVLGTQQPRTKTTQNPSEEPGWVRDLRVGGARVAAIGGYGLPWKCMKSYTGHLPGGGIRDFGIIVTPAWLGPAGNIRLPVLPIWTGLVADSLVWGTAWWLGLATAAYLRRAHRRRCTRCPACGYSLAGLGPGGPCPECGTRDRAAVVALRKEASPQP